MSKVNLWPKVKYLKRRDGSLFTLGDLPSKETKRWVIGRKADVVDAVRGGLITLEDACWRYSLTREEFLSWESAIDRFGTAALSAQRAQKYRRRDKRNGTHRDLRPDQRPSLPESANLSSRRPPSNDLPSSVPKLADDSYCPRPGRAALAGGGQYEQDLERFGSIRARYLLRE